MTKDEFRALKRDDKVYCVRLNPMEGEPTWFIIESTIASNTPLPECSRCTIRLEGERKGQKFIRRTRENMHTMLRDYALTPEAAIQANVVALTEKVRMTENDLVERKRKLAEAIAWRDAWLAEHPDGSGEVS